jgi:uncharacterized membrane protein
VATQNNPSGTTDEATISWQKSLYDPGYVNAMSHFYRGELGHHQQYRHYHDRVFKPRGAAPDLLF